MDSISNTKKQSELKITVEEINRLLDIGRLLFSVLTPKEIEALQKLLSSNNKIGNTGGS